MAEPAGPPPAPLLYEVIQAPTIDELMRKVNEKLTTEDYYVYHGVQYIPAPARAGPAAAPAGPAAAQKHIFLQVVVKLPQNFEQKIWNLIKESTVSVPTKDDQILALASDAIPLVLEALKPPEEKEPEL